ncbi:major facilitator superfamily domain-containing protein [Phascolomyces articulosus]|uniref:Major facilitator superfamily domain-containing protein n=1 Tax=Phascolomyces articulosus TaxID=60185 RepID=A0AAD5JMD6_9FUNG|nr:major facilitator superfamily domain-containing protein [Phascolomyces articulosus]
MICLIVSYAGLVSPFSGTIYYPALTQISQDFNVSVSLVNLTVTVYMIFQALSPSFWGPLSDLVGRRPVYIGTLTVLVGICIGLAKAPSYTALIVLRMFHAFGASSTIALGAGVISDFSTPAERGGYFSIFGSCQMISTTVGPVLGGVLSEELTWRWVFWILLIMGAVGLILVFFFVPETLRSLVGNGSGYANPTPSQWIKRRIANKKTGPQPSAPTTSKGPRKFPNFLEPFIFLRYPDVIIGMAINGCFTAVMYCFMTTTPTYFSSIYGLNELQVGLCYLPFGVGCFVGSSVSGRLLNKDFRTIALKQGITPDEIKKSGKLALDFPIYRARLRSCWISMILGELVTIVYGWTLCAETHLAVPIILQFLGGISSTPIFNCIQTLMADLFPGRGATITASANLVRCIFGAIATSTIQPGIDSVGLGWMFTIIGLILTITICLVPVLIKCGPRWRKNRVEQHQHREARKQRNNENNSSNPQTATTIEQ